MSTIDVLGIEVEVEEEMQRQVDRGYDAGHDARHGLWHLYYHIAKRAKDLPYSYSTQRRLLIQIAAMCFATIRAIDNGVPNKPEGDTNA